MGEYVPHPADTGKVELDCSLEALVEELAENVHENWARARLEQGWRYGERRDDGAKLHPCLVPYRDLSESEREYDRNTALETLKFVVSRGYRIVRV